MDRHRGVTADNIVNKGEEMDWTREGSGPERGESHKSFAGKHLACLRCSTLYAVR